MKGNPSAVNDSSYLVFMLILFPIVFILAVVGVIFGLVKNNKNKQKMQQANEQNPSLATSVTPQLWIFPPDFTVPIGGQSLWSNPLGGSQPAGDTAENIIFGPHPTSRRPVLSFTIKRPPYDMTVGCWHGIYLGVNLPVTRVYPNNYRNSSETGNIRTESITLNDLYKIESYDRPGAVSILTPRLINHLIDTPEAYRVGFRIENGWLYTYHPDARIAYAFLESVLPFLPEDINQVDSASIHPFDTIEKILPTLPIDAMQTGHISTD